MIKTSPNSSVGSKDILHGVLTQKIPKTHLAKYILMKHSRLVFTYNFTKHAHIVEKCTSLFSADSHD